MIRSSFLANMSHELRTPLNSCIAASELLIDEVFGSLNETQAKYLKNIWNSSNDLLQLINHLLDISKIEAGKVRLNIGINFARVILTEAVSVVKSLAYQKEIDLILEVEPEDLIVTADQMVLKQVLYNLLSNAIKFSNPQSKIRIRAKSGFINDAFSLPAVYFEVEDEGIGIRDSDLERVFVEFEQVDNSYSREYAGTGLGLPLSRKQVELHGGKLELFSHFGLGTKVIFYLPTIRDLLDPAS